MSTKAWRTIRRLWGHWQVLVLLLIVLGSLLLWLSDPQAFAGLSTLLAALIAGLVALSINETVAQRRSREREVDETGRAREREAQLHSKRSDVYYEILEHVLGSFGSKPPQRTEVSIRPLVAVWGSEEFTAAYQDWRTSISGLTGSGHSVPVPEDRKRPIQESLAQLVAAAKMDLGTDTDKQNVETLARLLFDDYEGESGKQSWSVSHDGGVECLSGT